MILAIAKNEFLQYFRSHKLTIAMLVCCTLVPLSVFMMLLDYDQRYENYTINHSQEQPPHFENFWIRSNWGSSSFTYPDTGLVRKPSKLSIFSKGNDSTLSGTFKLVYYFLDPVFGKRQERNVFASLFGSFDVLLVTKLAVGLLAVILGCGSVVSERQMGTLALILTNRIGRAQFIVGKFIGGVSVVLGSYIAGLILCLILLIAWPNWSFTTHDFFPVTSIFITFIIYLIFSYLLGMTISSLCGTTTTASITAVSIWLLIIILLPLLLLYCASIVHNVPSSEIAHCERLDAARTILEETKTQPGWRQIGEGYYRLPNLRGPGQATMCYKVAKVFGDIEQKHLNAERKQINLANSLLRLAPSGAMSNIVRGLTGTSPRSYLAYKSAGLKLRSELLDRLYPTIGQLSAIIEGKLNPEQFLWDVEPEPAKVQGYLQQENFGEKIKTCLEHPSFDQTSRPWPVSKKLEYNFAGEHEKYMKNGSATKMYSIADFASLLFATFLCFGLAFCFMMKYDVRYK